MGHYYTSDGERLSQATLDRRIRRAKALKLEFQRDDHGYNFCESCKMNDAMLDCSHDISVQHSKNNREAELCYSLDNITIRCRKCHQIYDKLC